MVHIFRGDVREGESATHFSRPTPTTLPFAKVAPGDILASEPRPRNTEARGKALDVQASEDARASLLTAATAR
jgi:hypothetical protein